MRERRQAQEWKDSRAGMFHQGAEQQAPVGDWWYDSEEATPFDVRWRGPFEGYR